MVKKINEAQARAVEAIQLAFQTATMVDLFKHLGMSSEADHFLMRIDSKYVPVEDFKLTALQLDAKYNEEGDGQHPYYSRRKWRDAVENEETISSYFEWVFDQLTEHQEETNEVQDGS